MKPKTLLFLATVTALLGAFVYFVERDLPSTDEKKELEKKVLALETDEVTSVTLRHEDSEVRLQRAPEPADGDTAEPEWRLVAPITARADARAVADLIRQLTGLRIERTLDAVDPVAAGLDAPRATVVVATADGEATLEVGGEVPLSKDALVRVRGETGGTPAAGRVVQTAFGSALLDTVAREAGDWRDKRLFFARRNDIESLAWTGPDRPRVLLTRRGDGDEFFLESPIQDRADTDQVRGLLSSLTSLEAASFADDETAEDFEPAERLEVVVAGDEPPWVLELGALPSDAPSDDTGTTTEPATDEGTADEDTETRRLARVDGQLVRLAKGAVTDAMAGTADDWRSRAWTHQQAFTIDEVLVAQGTQELLAIRRHESDWLRTTGDAARVSEDAEGEAPGEAVPYTVASNVLYPLTEMRAERLADDAAEPGVDLAAPILTVTLVTDDGEEVLSLYGQPEPGLQAARTSGRDAVLLLPAAKVGELLDAIAALRDAEPVPPPAVEGDGGDAADEDDTDAGGEDGG